MNKAILVAAAAAMTLTSTLATAQPYGHAYGYHRNHDRSYQDSDRDGRSDAQEWNRDRDRDGRPDQYDRYDDRRSGAYGYAQPSYRYSQQGYGYGQPGYGYNSSAYGYDGGWRTGQRYPYYNQRQYIIEDYRAYNLPPPRSGYRYYRSDNGDVVMAAIAGGLIGLIIGGALNDHHDGYRYR